MDRNDRRGIPLFADFYSLSLFFDKDNFLDVELAEKILPDLQAKLLDDVVACVCSEIKYFVTQTYAESKRAKIYRRFNLQSQDVFDFEYICTHNGFGKQFRYEWAKEIMGITRFMKFAQIVFTQGNFHLAYGGSNWARICKKWLQVKKINLQPFPTNPSPIFSIFDQLIDAAHNTGRCLDKLYPDINYWLGQKTFSMDFFFVVRESRIKKYAARRIKEKFGKCMEV